MAPPLESRVQNIRGKGVENFYGFYEGLTNYVFQDEAELDFRKRSALGPVIV